MYVVVRGTATSVNFYTAQELSINPTRTVHTTLYTALYSTLQTHRTTKLHYRLSLVSPIRVGAIPRSSMTNIVSVPTVSRSLRISTTFGRRFVTRINAYSKRAFLKYRILTRCTYSHRATQISHVTCASIFNRDFTQPWNLAKTIARTVHTTLYTSPYSTKILAVSKFLGCDKF